MDSKSLGKELLGKNIRWTELEERFGDHMIVYKDLVFDDGHVNDFSHASLVPLYICNMDGSAKEFIQGLFNNGIKFGITYTGEECTIISSDNRR